MNHVRRVSLREAIFPSARVDGALFCYCASRDTWVSYEWCLLIQGYFVRFKTMRRKQNLASAFGI